MLLEGTASSSQKKGKRNRSYVAVNIRVVDDLKGYKLSKAEAATTLAAQVGTPPTSASVESSLAKSAKKLR